MTDTDGLLRDAGGARPTSDVDALIERINALADCSYWANVGWVIPGDATQVIGRLAVQAAAAIASLDAERDALAVVCDERTRIAHVAEAERADLIKINNGWAHEWDAMREERDALRDLLRRLRQWDMLSEGNTPRLADRDYWCEQIDAAIDAAREKP